MHQHLAQTIMNARQIIRVSEISARQIVTTIKAVWQTNAVFEVHVDRFVIMTLPAEMVKFVKIDCAKSVAEMI